MKTKVWQLGWSGMEKVSVDIEDIPTKALAIDDWFAPSIGELCINDNNQLDVIKEIYWQKGNQVFNGGLRYKFENSTGVSCDNQVIRVRVKRGKTFIFKGKVYVPREALDGGYIEQMAKHGKVSEYEYEEFK